MAAFNPHWWRVAAAFCGELARQQPPPITLPTGAWNRCTQVARRLHRAELRGWQLAALELRRDLAYGLAALQAELQTLASVVPGPRRGSTLPVSEVYRDLVALANEFADLTYDLAGRWLSVTIEPLMLDGVYLGPFEIRLDFCRLRQDRPYRVLAIDPQPAESRPNVTHPHVMDEHLCEGDGRSAIRESLAQGRIFDFFTLIATGLRSYNAESPFVGLEAWYGTSCDDCGTTVNSEESYACQRCGNVLCESCESSCSSCGESYCTTCIRVCPTCEDAYCSGCLQTCAECGRSFCSSCLNENGRCTNCDEQDDFTVPTTEESAFQPTGLGQTPVSP